MQLSKSDYLMFLKHPAWLWLKKHDKQALPPFDDNTLAMFAAGHEFETYAEQLFPNGQRLGFDDFYQYRSLPRRTKEVLDDGADTIFQGRFEHGDLTCIIDVLDRVKGRTFDLYEIKSATKAKPEYLDDLAFQTIVLEGSGLTIDSISVIVVNRDYVRQGQVDPKQLTTTIDLTKDVRAKIDETQQQIQNALAVMQSDSRPDISPRHAHQQHLKEWLEIFHTFNIDADPYSIYTLSPATTDLIGELEDQGIERIADIPEDFEFDNYKQRQLVALAKHGQPVIETERIRDFLGALKFPLYFFDYETFSRVVPPVDGTRPYQQIPMQYSLHILGQDGQLEHCEFLHQDPTNPAPALIKQLRQDIGQTGSVIVWHEAFEKSRNTDLGAMVPDAAEFMADLNNRIVDLKLPFSEGWYQDYRFLGSASIKKVLPVLVPDLSYKELDVQEGQTAQRIWMETVLDGKHANERDKIMKNLLEYCQLDTLAMVKIYHVLRNLTDTPNTPSQQTLPFNAID